MSKSELRKKQEVEGRSVALRQMRRMGKLVEGNSGVDLETVLQEPVFTTAELSYGGGRVKRFLRLIDSNAGVVQEAGSSVRMSLLHEVRKVIDSAKDQSLDNFPRRGPERLLRKFNLFLAPGAKLLYVPVRKNQVAYAYRYERQRKLVASGEKIAALFGECFGLHNLNNALSSCSERDVSKMLDLKYYSVRKHDVICKHLAANVAKWIRTHSKVALGHLRAIIAEADRRQQLAAVRALSGCTSIKESRSLDKATLKNISRDYRVYARLAEEMHMLNDVVKRRMGWDSSRTFVPEYTPEETVKVFKTRNAMDKLEPALLRYYETHLKDMGGDLEALLIRMPQATRHEKLVALVSKFCMSVMSKVRTDSLLKTSKEVVERRVRVKIKATLKESTDEIMRKEIRCDEINEFWDVTYETVNGKYPTLKELDDLVAASDKKANTMEKISELRETVNLYWARKERKEKEANIVPPGWVKVNGYLISEEVYNHLEEGKKAMRRLRSDKIEVAEMSKAKQRVMERLHLQEYEDECRRSVAVAWRVQWMDFRDDMRRAEEAVLTLMESKRLVAEREEKERWRKAYEFDRTTAHSSKMTSNTKKSRHYQPWRDFKQSVVDPQMAAAYRAEQERQHALFHQTNQGLTVQADTNAHLNGSHGSKMGKDFVSGTTPDHEVDAEARVLFVFEDVDDDWSTSDEEEAFDQFVLADYPEAVEPLDFEHARQVLTDIAQVRQNVDWLFNIVYAIICVLMLTVSYMVGAGTMGCNTLNGANGSCRGKDFVMDEPTFSLDQGTTIENMNEGGDHFFLAPVRLVLERPGAKRIHHWLFWLIVLYYPMAAILNPGMVIVLANSCSLLCLAVVVRGTTYGFHYQAGFGVAPNDEYPVARILTNSRIHNLYVLLMFLLCFKSHKSAFGLAMRFTCGLFANWCLANTITTFHTVGIMSTCFGIGVIAHDPPSHMINTILCVLIFCFALKFGFRNGVLIMMFFCCYPTAMAQNSSMVVQHRQSSGREPIVVIPLLLVFCLLYCLSSQFRRFIMWYLNLCIVMFCLGAIVGFIHTNYHVLFEHHWSTIRFVFMGSTTLNGANGSSRGKDFVRGRGPKGHNTQVSKHGDKGKARVFGPHPPTGGLPCYLGPNRPPPPEDPALIEPEEVEEEPEETEEEKFLNKLAKHSCVQARRFSYVRKVNGDPLPASLIDKRVQRVFQRDLFAGDPLNTESIFGPPSSVYNGVTETRVLDKWVWDEDHRTPVIAPGHAALPAPQPDGGYHARVGAEIYDFRNHDWCRDRLRHYLMKSHARVDAPRIAILVSISIIISMFVKWFFMGLLEDAVALILGTSIIDWVRPTFVTILECYMVSQGLFWFNCVSYLLTFVQVFMFTTRHLVFEHKLIQDYPAHYVVGFTEIYRIHQPANTSDVRAFHKAFVDLKSNPDKFMFKNLEVPIVNKAGWLSFYDDCDKKHLHDNYKYTFTRDGNAIDMNTIAEAMPDVTSLDARLHRATFLNRFPKVCCINYKKGFEANAVEHLRAYNSYVLHGMCRDFELLVQSSNRDRGVTGPITSSDLYLGTFGPSL